MRVIFILFITIQSSFISLSQNLIDKNGNKQGYWTVESFDTVKYSYVFRSNGLFSPGDTTIIKRYIKLEGYYKDNKRTGVWTSRYGANIKNIYGDVMSTVTFTDGELSGEIIVYYENGSYRYKGNIRLNKEIAELKERGAMNSPFFINRSLRIDDIINKWTYLNEL